MNQAARPRIIGKPGETVESAAARLYYKTVKYRHKHTQLIARRPDGVLVRLTESSEGPIEIALDPKTGEPLGMRSEVHEARKKKLELAAEHGDPKSQYILGLNYIRGDGVERNFEEGVKRLSAAAAANEPSAICELARIYESGEGLPAEPDRAAALYSIASDRSLFAATSLGRMYAEGRGVAKDLHKAWSILRDAAIRGSGKAVPLLAELSTSQLSQLGEAKGEAAIWQQARDWVQVHQYPRFLEAAKPLLLDQGAPSYEAESQRRALSIAEAYSAGSPVPKSETHALWWFDLVSNGENRELAGLAHKRIGDLLSVSQDSAAGEAALRHYAAAVELGQKEAARSLEAAVENRRREAMPMLQRQWVELSERHLFTLSDSEREEIRSKLAELVPVLLFYGGVCGLGVLIAWLLEFDTSSIIVQLIAFGILGYGVWLVAVGCYAAYSFLARTSLARLIAAIGAAAIVAAITLVVLVPGGHDWTALAEGRRMIDQSQFDAAARALRKLAASDEKFAEAHEALGHALLGTGDYASAQAEYSKAIELDPVMSSVYMARGWVRWLDTDLAGAIADYRQLVRLEPNYLQGYLQLERVLYEINRPLEVATLWREAEHVNPTWTASTVYRMRALAAAEEWQQIREEMPAVLAKKDFSENANMRYWYGRALSGGKQYDDAIPQLERAVSIFENNAPKDLASLKLCGEELFYAYVWAKRYEDAENWRKKLEQKLRGSAN